MSTKLKSLIAAFERYADEYGRFERVQNPLFPRQDLCAFLLLDKLCPSTGRGCIGSAGHDKLYLSVDCERLSSVATEDDIMTLVRCGVCIERASPVLVMYLDA